MSMGTFGVAPQDTGVASAVLNAGQQIGGSIGTSLLNTLAASATVNYLTTHVTPGAMVNGQPGPHLEGLAREARLEGSHPQSGYRVSD